MIVRNLLFIFAPMLINSFFYDFPILEMRDLWEKAFAPQMLSVTLINMGLPRGGFNN